MTCHQEYIDPVRVCGDYASRVAPPPLSRTRFWCGSIVRKPIPKMELVQFYAFSVPIYGADAIKSVVRRGALLGAKLT